MAYFTRRPSYGRQVYYIVCIVAVLAGTLFSVWGPGGYLEMRKARTELQARRARVEALRQENAQRYRRVESLRSDPGTVEELARQKGFARDGEIIQPVTPSPPPSDPKAPKR